MLTGSCAHVYHGTIGTLLLGHVLNYLYVSRV
jgi:hypothetical protein